MVPLYSLSIEHVICLYENEIFDRFCVIIFSILSVNCSHKCIIYFWIYKKISNGGLKVSLSIYILEALRFKRKILLMCSISAYKPISNM